MIGVSIYIYLGEKKEKIREKVGEKNGRKTKQGDSCYKNLSTSGGMVGSQQDQRVALPLRGNLNKYLKSYLKKTY